MGEFFRVGFSDFFGDFFMLSKKTSKGSFSLNREKEGEGKEDRGMRKRKKTSTREDGVLENSEDEGRITLVPE